jgi:hypothetical protein
MTPAVEVEKNLENAILNYGAIFKIIFCKQMKKDRRPNDKFKYILFF